MSLRRESPSPGRWWRVPLLVLLSLAGLLGLGWVLVWLRRDDDGPPGTSVSQSPGPPASRAVHRVEPDDDGRDEPAAPPSLATATAPESATASVGDDLTRVQGVGTRSAEALAAAGIGDLRALSEASAAQVGDALDAAGLRRSPTFATWPGQARDLLGPA
ncbi:hypothetical protein [Aquipuribacter sp. SD81]|uniref:hypothetical protein n=1 Tax=Aquipuribacter sp. SD81 TaxID=3127703 RepID=UPI00301B4FE3